VLQPLFSGQEVTMKMSRVGLIAFLLIASLSVTQTKIIIPAGTPEDKALGDVSQEPANDKKIAMLNEFVEKYSSNPAAVAYGNWQLSQLHASAEPNKGLEYGDKALAAMPDVLDIIQSQADLAQQTKNYSKVVDYAVRGAVVINGLDKRPKPEGTDEESWKQSIEREKAQAAPIYDYLGAAAYNALGAETDAKKRAVEIERYMEGFRGTKLAENASLLAVATFQEMNDLPRLVAFGEKALAADPKNTSLYTLMANAFAEDPQGTNLLKADNYARKAIELAKTDDKLSEENRIVTEGFAHQVLGYTLLRQDKTPAAIAELKTASAMLKSDAAKYSITLYRLGFAYAKANQNANAKQVLSEAVTVDGPFQAASRELLGKVNAAKPAQRK
jgi:tetratricopeptide (TPR) repeat protein